MLIAFALSAGLLPTEPIPERLRGSTLYRNCKIVDSVPANESIPNGAPALECMNYISGFTDAFIASGQMCPTDNTTHGTVLKVYLAFMDRNPKLLDENRVAGLMGALYGAYPCGRKASK